MHCRRAGKQSGNDKSNGKSAYQRKDRSDPMEVHARRVIFTNGISEAQLTDEGRQSGGKKGNMNILADLFFHDAAIKKNTEEGRPHIQKIQTVEAMGNDEHITGKNGGVGLSSADVDDQIGKQSANCRIEQGASQSANCKIIGDELARRRQDM